jgi:gamma-glutamylcyclotransferase (GGCT)/AIG2-like uncharacterized protein YtfP
MPGRRNHRHIARFVRGSQPGRIEGRLAVWRRAPGLVAGEGQVLGVLLDVMPEALNVADEIEDYRPDADDSLYVRRRVEVRVEAGPPILAWTYFFGDVEQLTDRERCRVGQVDKSWVYEWRS